MTPQRYQRVREIYQAACELSGEARTDMVTRACAGDDELLAEVSSLLAHHDGEDDDLGDSNLGLGYRLIAAGDAQDDRGEFEATPPTTTNDSQAVGRYRLIRRIGEGGMGSVYEAEQEHPVRRRVALKIIKLGMDTREVVARFQQERQALALLDHPNIAKVLDAGATPTGRPYFVMELCAGERITDYCDARRLSIQARLELFIQVCHAIQHAHQKALIHRDIKPSNVLVATQNDLPLARVIDFGIAKSMGGKLTEVTLQTEDMRLVGTPEYMSPEQAEGRRDIDTRTDVYSLGVLLYELLTGCTPFSSKDLRSASQADIQRFIREVDPITPSTRVRHDTNPGTAIADARGTSRQQLSDSLRGDLDWIVGKSLEKDPSRRYQAAGELAADIHRHLAGEAVTAAPPSTAYRMRKFVRRNRALVLGAAVVSSALIVGAITTLWQASVARREAMAARSAENDARRIAAFQARMLEQIDTTSAGDNLLADMRTQFKSGIDKSKLSPESREAHIAEFEEHLRQLNPTDLAAGLIDTTILKPSVDSIAREFSAQPIVEASLNQTLATLYRTIGRYSDARPLQEKALASRTRVLGESDADTLNSMYELGYLMRLQGDLPGAEALLNETLAKCRAALGPDHPITLTTQSTCGGILRLNKHHAEAEACWRDVLERRRRVLGPDDQNTIISINNLGAVLQDAGKLGEAETYFREALERGRRALGPDHPNTLISQNFLGGLLWRQNRLDEAESIHRETLEKRRRILGELHPRTINSVANLGELLFAAGKHAEAEPFLREACEKRKQVLGASHTLTHASIDGLAGLFEAETRWKEAEALRREAVTALALSENAKPADIALARMQHGRALLECKRLAEAEDTLIAAHQSLGAAGAKQKEAASACVTLLVRLYEDWDKADPDKGHLAKRDSWKAMEGATLPTTQTGERIE